MKTDFNRRTFLRGAGALVALPALESIGFRRFASAATKASIAIPNSHSVLVLVASARPSCSALAL